MNTRIQILGTLLLLTACDFEPKDIGDPSGDTIDSSGAAEASTSGYATEGPNSTSQGGSDTSNGSSTGVDTSTSTTGADPTVGSSTTDADPTVSTTTGPDPTVGSSTTGDPTGDPSTSMGDTSNSTGGDSTSMGDTGTGTTSMGDTSTTTGGEMTSTSTGGEQPGPVACDANPPTFPSFDKQCASKADCTIVAHTIDCCGSERLIGINEGAVVEFNQAEQVCDEQLPQCDCLANPPLAEDGNSVLNPEEASLACNNNQCETFVF